MVHIDTWTTRQLHRKLKTRTHITRILRLKTEKHNGPNICTEFPLETDNICRFEPEIRQTCSRSKQDTLLSDNTNATTFLDPCRHQYNHETTDFAITITTIDDGHETFFCQTKPSVLNNTFFPSFPGSQKK